MTTDAIVDIGQWRGAVTAARANTWQIRLAGGTQINFPLTGGATQGAYMGYKPISIKSCGNTHKGVQLISNKADTIMAPTKNRKVGARVLLECHNKEFVIRSVCEPQIRIKLISPDRGKAMLIIEAPKEVVVLREELVTE